MAKQRFMIYLEPAEEGGYIVRVPALPGCVTQGETREEALKMAQDAIAGYLASLVKHGEPIPQGTGEIDTVEVEVTSS
ncbi:MAG: type II toxin-antitoxin system HicB family antitoxin [Firmicutes bacterium]|nr:type II toxin-antitoxin system HicB family antitoxin [Bacillota bacterium]